MLPSAAAAAPRSVTRGAPLELVLAGGARIPLVEDLTIGRGPSATLRLDDPSVSRVHARISAGADPARRGSRTPARATGRSSTARA